MDLLSKINNDLYKVQTLNLLQSPADLSIYNFLSCYSAFWSTYQFKFILKSNSSQIYWIEEVMSWSSNQYFIKSIATEMYLDSFQQSAFERNLKQNEHKPPFCWLVLWNQYNVLLTDCNFNSVIWCMCVYMYVLFNVVIQ